jgi:hypothetical protein
MEPIARDAAERWEKTADAHHAAVGETDRGKS